MSLISNLVARLSLDYGPYERGLRESRTMTDRFRREVDDATGGLYSMARAGQSVQRAIHTMGIGLGGYAIARVFQAGAAEIQTMAKNIDELSPGMRKHAADINEAANNLEKLKESYRSLKQEAAIHLLAPVINTAAMFAGGAEGGSLLSHETWMTAKQERYREELARARERGWTQTAAALEKDIRRYSETEGWDLKLFDLLPLQLFDDATMEAIDKVTSWINREIDLQINPNELQEIAAAGGPIGIGGMKIPSPVVGILPAEYQPTSDVLVEIGKALEKIRIEAGRLNMTPARAQLQEFQEAVKGLSGRDLELATAWIAEFEAAIKKIEGQAQFKATVDKIVARQESVKALVAEMEDQARIMSMVELGWEKSDQAAAARIQIQRAYGEGTSETTEMLKRYGDALEIVTNLEERRKLASESQIEAERKAAQAQAQAERKAADRVRAAEDMQRMLESIRIERELIGRFDVPREYARDWQSYSEAAAERFGKGSDAYAAAMYHFEQRIKGLRLAEMANEVGENFSTAFEDVILNIRSADEAIKAFAQDLARLAIRQAITQPLSYGISNAVQGLFSGGLSGVGGSSRSIWAGGSLADYGYTTAVAHSGWMVGAPPSLTRQVSSEMIQGASRYHGGLAPDEFPAILQRGEMVIPRDVTREIIRTERIERMHDGGLVGSEGGSFNLPGTIEAKTIVSASPPSVTVNVTNNTQSQVKAQPTVRFDRALREFVIGVVLDEEQANMAFRNR